MRTTLQLPDDLISEAARLAKTKTKTETIILALKDFIRRRQLQKLIKASGTILLHSNWEKMRHDR